MAIIMDFLLQERLSSQIPSGPLNFLLSDDVFCGVPCTSARFFKVGANYHEEGKKSKRLCQSAVLRHALPFAVTLAALIYSYTSHSFFILLWSPFWILMLLFVVNNSVIIQVMQPFHFSRPLCLCSSFLYPLFHDFWFNIIQICCPF